MVRVPVRAAPLFEATLNVTAPMPVPLAPATTVIHGAWLVAVREQPAVPLTATVTEPPAALTASFARSSENTQFGCGFGGVGVVDDWDDWVNVTVWPATRSAALRVSPALGSTRRRTLPLPVPLVLVSATQPASTLACQPQPVGVVTAMVTVPPAAPMVGRDRRDFKSAGRGSLLDGDFLVVDRDVALPHRASGVGGGLKFDPPAALTGRRRETGDPRRAG